MEIEKMRMASHLLPDPGGEVVRECLDEIERLKAHVAQLQEVERTLRAVVRGVEVLAYNLVDNADGRLGPQCIPPCPENGHVRNETTIHVAQQLTKVVGALWDRNRS